MILRAIPKIYISDISFNIVFPQHNIEGYFFNSLGELLAVSCGQVVHQECRHLYCHPNQERSRQRTENVKVLANPKTRTSIESKFDFQTNCIFVECLQNTNIGNEVVISLR